MSGIVKYKMKLEVITPVHIGGVDYKSDLSTTEYVYDPNKKSLVIIDNSKFVKFLNKKGMFDIYLEHIKRNTFGQKNQQNKKVDIYKFLKSNNLHMYIGDFTKEKYTNLAVNKTTLNDVNLLIKNALGKPYIPGSSIKGAIVNNLIVDYIIKNRKQFDSSIKDIISETVKIKGADFFDKTKINNYKNIVKKKIDKIQEEILYKSEKERVKRFGLSISDTYEEKDVKINFLQDIDENIENGNFIDMMTIREYIMPKSIFYFDMIIDRDIFKIKSKLNIKCADDVIKAIKNANEYMTGDVLELEFKEKDLIIGANTGFHQKTIVHSLFTDYNQRTEVTKRLLHKKFDINRKKRNDKISDHSQDECSPRILNQVKEYDGIDIAGLVNISVLEEKNVV